MAKAIKKLTEEQKHLVQLHADSIRYLLAQHLRIPQSWYFQWFSTNPYFLSDKLHASYEFQVYHPEEDVSTAEGRAGIRSIDAHLEFNGTGRVHCTFYNFFYTPKQQSLKEVYQPLTHIVENQGRQSAHQFIGHATSALEEEIKKSLATPEGTQVQINPILPEPFGSLVPEGTLVLNIRFSSSNAQQALHYATVAVGNASPGEKVEIIHYPEDAREPYRSWKRLVKQELGIQ